MILIERWLNGNQNFIVGKVLYSHFGNDRSLRELFDKGETPFAKDMLCKALKTIHEFGCRTTKQPEIAQFMPMPAGTDKILQAIEEQWKPLYQHMNFLRHKLDQFEQDNSTPVRETRKENAATILEIERKCNLIWSKRNYYLQHGKLPEEKEEEFTIPEDPLQLAKLIERLKRYVRKHKKNLKENPGNATYAALLTKYENQLQQINHLNDPKTKN